MTVFREKFALCSASAPVCVLAASSIPLLFLECAPSTATRSTGWHCRAGSYSGCSSWCWYRWTWWIGSSCWKLSSWPPWFSLHLSRSADSASTSPAPPASVPAPRSAHFASSWILPFASLLPHRLSPWTAHLFFSPPPFLWNLLFDSSGLFAPLCQPGSSVLFCPPIYSSAAVTCCAEAASHSLIFDSIILSAWDLCSAMLGFDWPRWRRSRGPRSVRPWRATATSFCHWSPNFYFYFASDGLLPRCSCSLTAAVQNWISFSACRPGNACHSNPLTSLILNY